MNTATTRDAAGWSFGPALILTGLAAILFSARIEHAGLGANHDPGPRAFPIGLGALLVLGGGAQLVQWFWRRRNTGVTPVSDRQVERFPTSRIDIVILLAALVFYVAALPWMGFSLSTLIFSGAMMRRMGARWTMALGMSLALVVVIQLLFVQLFKVQLPTGPWGIPF